jgi:hypothetical protein
MENRPEREGFLENLFHAQKFFAKTSGIGQNRLEKTWNILRD